MKVFLNVYRYGNKYSTECKSILDAIDTSYIGHVTGYESFVSISDKDGNVIIGKDDIIEEWGVLYKLAYDE